MRLDISVLNELRKIAVDVAREAGALISHYSELDFKVERKEGCESLATQVVTEVDERAQEMILKHLLPTLNRYELALLTEESPDDGSRFEKDYFWCIDPLDGTLPFTQRKPGYAVSIALIAKTGEPVIAVVYDPVRGLLYDAVIGQGVRCNEEPFVAELPSHAVADSVLRICCDCSFDGHPQRARIEQGVAQVAKRLGYREHLLEIGGGAVMNACRVFEAAPACYFKEPKMKAGGGSIWDFAATALLLAELGYVVTDFAGGALDLNRADSSFMNHHGVCYASDPSVQEALHVVFSEME
ncbi:MAG: 3'(2'),5'-bisphosphate nucleotidase CysQ family protein [Opitutaceae bacterium]